jgi:sporulation protein YunB
MKRRRKRRWLCVLSVISLLVLGFWIFVEAQIKPIMKKYGVKSAQSLVTQVINEEMTNCLAASPSAEWVRLERDGQGDVALLEVNAQQVNGLKLSVIGAVLERLEGEDVCDFGVPLGTLIMPEVFTSKGPILSLDVGLDSTVSAELFTEWQGAGINQTVHRLKMRVQVDMVLALSFDEHIETTVVSEYLVAETVLVGKVPETAFGQWTSPPNQ